MAPVIQEERSNQTDSKRKDPVNEEPNWGGLVIANLWDIEPYNRSRAKLESAHEYDHHNELKSVFRFVTCIPHDDHADNDGNLINQHQCPSSCYAKEYYTTDSRYEVCRIHNCWTLVSAECSCILEDGWWIENDCIDSGELLESR